jgi:hypothetical protein
MNLNDYKLVFVVVGLIEFCSLHLKNQKSRKAHAIGEIQ